MSQAAKKVVISRYERLTLDICLKVTLTQRGHKNRQLLPSQYGNLIVVVTRLS